MTASNFDKTLKTLRNRKPFKTFRVHFLDGEFVDVTEPEAIFVRAGLGVHFDTNGELTLLSHEGVSEVVDKVR